MESLLMTIPEAARRLRVSCSFAYELARQRVIPTIRLGDRALRVPAQELDRWLARRTMKAAEGDGPEPGR